MKAFAPVTAGSDVAGEMPADRGARLDRARLALRGLREERRRCERLGLETPLARVEAQIRYWRFVGALVALDSGEELE